MGHKWPKRRKERKKYATIFNNAVFHRYTLDRHTSTFLKKLVVRRIDSFVPSFFNDKKLRILLCCSLHREKARRYTRPFAAYVNYWHAIPQGKVFFPLSNSFFSPRGDLKPFFDKSRLSRESGSYARSTIDSNVRRPFFERPTPVAFVLLIRSRFGRKRGSWIIGKTRDRSVCRTDSVARNNKSTTLTSTSLNRVHSRGYRKNP